MFKKFILCFGLTVSVTLAGAAEHPFVEDKPNIVIFSVDDMDYESLGVTGCPIPGISPHLDQLASKGILFTKAHVASPACGPSRQSMMTAKHPHVNGSLGFLPVSKEHVSLSQVLMENGYYAASFNKGRDYESFAWDKMIAWPGQGFGRDPELFYKGVLEQIKVAQGQGKPVFLNVATSDPHRPFSGAPQEEEKLASLRKKYPTADFWFPEYKEPTTEAEVPIPPFLPDLPAIRTEMKEYFRAVKRADDALGKVLQALKDGGIADNTIIIWFSDNGISMPTAKASLYVQGTRTPFIVKWPGIAVGARTDDEHFVSAMDIMPTLLEGLNIPVPAGLNGRSFYSLLQGEAQKDRDYIFTTFNFHSLGMRDYPMRAIISDDHCYIYNAFGGRAKHSECQSGRTMAAIEEAAKSDEKMAAVVKRIRIRPFEEFFDLKEDPYCQHNLLADETSDNDELNQMRRILLGEMEATKDPLLSYYQKREPGFPEAWSIRSKRKKQE